MRFATFNIRNGGADADGWARLAEIAVVIRDVNPDVLAIEEANGFLDDGGALLHQIEQATGMRGHVCRTRSGFDVALLVKPDLQVVRRGSVKRGFRHGTVYADIALADGSEVRAIGTHLDPDSGSQRLAEVGRLLRRVGVRSQVVLMGDLNSLDRTSGDLRSVEALLPQHRSRYLLPRPFPGSPVALDTRAIDALEAAGLGDLVDVAHPGVHQATAPTRGGGGEEFHRMRLDRLFGTRAVRRRVTAGGVRTAAPADTASDHYLAWIDVDLVAARRATRRGTRVVRPMSPGVS